MYQQRPGGDTRGSGALHPGEGIIIMTMWLMSIKCYNVILSGVGS